jgi:hypothetical protein
MLDVARRNCREANVRLLRQDLRTLLLPELVDLVTANFDTINHLLCPDDVRAAFNRIAGNLRAGGYFIFDLITPCQNLVEERTYARNFVVASGTMQQKIRWNSKQRTLSVLVVIRSPSSPTATVESHRERTYSPAEVARWLLEAGFVIRGVHDAATLKSARGCSPRIIIVAQKRFTEIPKRTNMSRS